MSSAGHIQNMINSLKANSVRGRLKRPSYFKTKQDAKSQATFSDNFLFETSEDILENQKSKALENQSKIDFKLILNALILLFFLGFFFYSILQ